MILLEPVETEIRRKLNEIAEVPAVKPERHCYKTLAPSEMKRNFTG